MRREGVSKFFQIQSTRNPPDSPDMPDNLNFLLCGGCWIKPRLTYDGKMFIYRDSSLKDVSISKSKHIIHLKSSQPIRGPIAKKLQMAVNWIEIEIKCWGDEPSTHPRKKVQMSGKGVNYRWTFCPARGTEITSRWTQVLLKMYGKGFLFYWTFNVRRNPKISTRDPWRCPAKLKNILRTRQIPITMT